MQRQCAACDEEEPRVSRIARDAWAPAEVPSIVDDVNRTRGEPLDDGLRSRFERGFRWSFADVRIHRDERAAEAARAVNARAYTSGQHIVFAQGQFNLASTTGQQLLAHELAHVVQQGTTTVAPGISRPGDHAERHAEGLARLATGAASFDRAGSTSPASRSGAAGSGWGAPTTRQEGGVANQALLRWPGDGMVPPGDCDWGTYTALNLAVDLAKAVVDALGGCRAGDSCAQLAAKIAAITAEIVARVTLDTTCFKGGDTGHREQVDNKVRMLINCYEQFGRKNCLAELAAAAAAATAAATAAAEAETATAAEAEAAEAAEAATEIVEGAEVAGEAVEGGVTVLEVLEIAGLVLVL